MLVPLKHEKPLIEPVSIAGPLKVWVQNVETEAFEVFYHRNGESKIRKAMCFAVVHLGEMFGYQSKNSLRKLINNYKPRVGHWILSPEEFTNLYNRKESKVEALREFSPHFERVYIFGAGLDFVAVKSNAVGAQAFQEWIAEKSFQLRTEGVAYADDRQRPRISDESLKEQNRQLQRMVDLQQTFLEQSIRINDLKTEVSSLQRQLDHDSERERRILAIVDEKINHQQGQREDEWSKLEAAREFDLFYPGTGKGRRHQAKFIGAIMKKHKFVKRRLARNGVWIDDSQIDRTTGEKGRVREAQYLNAAGMDQLELILPTFGLLAGEPKYIKLDDGDRSGHNVVWEPPAYVRSRRNRRR